MLVGYWLIVFFVCLLVCLYVYIEYAVIISINIDRENVFPANLITSVVNTLSFSRIQTNIKCFLGLQQYKYKHSHFQ